MTQSASQDLVPVFTFLFLEETSVTSEDVLVLFKDDAFKYAWTFLCV